MRHAVHFKQTGPEQDPRADEREDIRTLYRLCRFKTSDEGLALVQRFYPGRKLEPKIRLLLEELYGPSTPLG